MPRRSDAKAKAIETAERLFRTKGYAATGLTQIREQVTLGLTVLLLVAFAFISVRGLLAPGPASARFGVAAVAPDGVLFYRVYLSRNLVIVIFGFAFLALDQRKSLAMLMTFAAALPLFDAGILLAELGARAPLTPHVVAFVWIGLVAVLSWMRATHSSAATGAAEPA